MARYFFHVLLEGTLLADHGGQELADPDAAWEAADRAARDLMNTDLGRPVNWHNCFFEVRTADDEIVLEFPFVEAIEVKGPVN
jgi:hypothetical protein